MEREDFYNGIDKLEKFYGKELNETEVIIWEQSLMKMNKERFEQIIQECFKSKSFMPKLATIYELDKLLPRKKIEEQEEEKVDCKYCQGYGLFELEYEKNESKYHFGARCVCKNGDKYYMYKTIKDFGILKSDYFGNNEVYKIKPYVLELIKKRLNDEKMKKVC